MAVPVGVTPDPAASPELSAGSALSGEYLYVCAFGPASRVSSWHILARIGAMGDGAGLHMHIVVYSFI